jgi:phosphoribosylformylglycinamidine cyclo-ligase
MSRYEALGVNVRKPGIESFKGAIENLYPGAFCVVQRDPADPQVGLVTHTDSAGTKPIQAYIGYRETGDAAWFRGLAQDALAMNLNDVACVGAEPVTFVDYVAFNTLLIDRVRLLGALAEGFQGCLDAMRGEGLQFMFAGGETADLPDLLRTLDVCVTMVGRVKLSDVVTGSRVAPGDLIVGVRSGGGARYERGVNSGIMSNGHTLARASLMSPEYVERYPEVSHPSRGRYTGRFRFGDYLDELGSTLGEALLSPTRLFAPVAREALRRAGPGVHGMVHNTGGGQTKCLRLGDRVAYVKDRLPEPDPVFGLVQREGGVEWREMYQDFNMGVGFEIIAHPDAAEDVVSAAESLGVGASIIGRCGRSKGGNTLRLSTPRGDFTYG